jgi:hypothetical protein
LTAQHRQLIDKDLALQEITWSITKNLVQNLCNYLITVLRFCPALWMRIFSDLWLFALQSHLAGRARPNNGRLLTLEEDN